MRYPPRSCMHARRLKQLTRESEQGREEGSAREESESGEGGEAASGRLCAVSNALADTHLFDSRWTIDWKRSTHPVRAIVRS